MTRPALIVYEPSPRWATALRQASAGVPLPLVETRRLADVWQALVAAPTSLAALAWSARQEAELAELVDRVGRRFPHARIVALVERGNHGGEALARELGAIYACCSPRQAGVVIRLARRHLGRQAVETSWPAMHESIGQIWQTLPWNTEEGLAQA